MRGLTLSYSDRPIEQLLCLGAHCDDIEIGCSATVLTLLAQYPDLKPHLFNEGKLRSFVNVFLGEEDVRYLNGIETPVAGDSKLLIIPSIAGGR